MAEGAFGAEESDAKRFFQGETAAHDFAIDGVEAAVGKRAVVEEPDAFQHGFLAVGGIDGGALGLLELSDLDHHACPGIEQLDDLLIELVDLQA